MKYTMYFAGLIACFFSIVAAQAQESKFLNSPARKLQLAEFAIANLYVDEVNEGKLVEEAIVKMLEQLDPHSTYSDPEEVKRMNEPLQGNFEGIGIQFNMAEGNFVGDTACIGRTVRKRRYSGRGSYSVGGRNADQRGQGAYRGYWGW